MSSTVKIILGQAAAPRNLLPAVVIFETMPRYYCDYCDTYLTHDSVRPLPKSAKIASQILLYSNACYVFTFDSATVCCMQPVVRKQHNTGYKHKANVRNYYMQFEEAQTQELIDSKIMEHLARAGDPSKVSYAVTVAFAYHCFLQTRDAEQRAMA